MQPQTYTEETQTSSPIDVAFHQQPIQWRIADFLEPLDAWSLTVAVKIYPEYWFHRAKWELNISPVELIRQVNFTGFGVVALIISHVSQYKTIRGSERFIDPLTIQLRAGVVPVSMVKVTHGPLDPIIIKRLLMSPDRPFDLTITKRSELFNRLNPINFAKVMMKRRPIQLRNLYRLIERDVIILTDPELNGHYGFIILMAVRLNKPHIVNYIIVNFVIGSSPEIKVAVSLAAYKGLRDITIQMLSLHLGDPYMAVQSAAYGGHKSLAMELGRRFISYVTAMRTEYLVGLIKGDRFIQFVCGFLEWSLHDPDELYRVLGITEDRYPHIEYSKLLNISVYFNRPRFVGFILDLIRPGSLLEACYLYSFQVNCPLMRLVARNGYLEVLVILAKYGFDLQPALDEATKAGKIDIIKMLRGNIIT